MKSLTKYIENCNVESKIKDSESFMHGGGGAETVVY